MIHSSRWTNVKSGLIYVVINDCVRNCTNDRDGEIMVQYHALDNDQEIYVREKTEFLKKFIPCH